MEPPRAHGCGELGGGGQEEVRGPERMDSRHRDGSTSVAPLQKGILRQGLVQSRRRGSQWPRAARTCSWRCAVWPGWHPAAWYGCMALLGAVRCCTVLYGAARCCTAAARHQCPLEAATHSPHRHRADCTVPDCDHPVPGAQLSSEPSGRSGCFWGAGSHQHYSPRGPCPKGGPVPPRT